MDCATLSTRSTTLTITTKRSHVHNRRASTSISGWINGFIGVAILAARYPPPASPCRSSILFPDFLPWGDCRGACAGPDLAFTPAAPASGTMAFTGAGCRRRGHRFSAADGTGVAAGDVCPLNCFIGLLPLATAIFAVIRGGERPRPAFWGFSLLGSILVASFALAGNTGCPFQATC